MRSKLMFLFLVLSALSLTVSAQDNSVLDIIVSSPNHNTLEAAVVATGLDSPLSGEGPFTVFAPTDAVFALLPAGTLDALLNDIPFLTDILVHHLVGDFVLSSDFSDGQELSTLLGYDLTVTVNSNAVFIDNAMITVADIVADNGVVHVIDALLLPPAPIVSDDLPWTHQCSIEDCDSWVFDNGSSISGSPWEDIDLNFECSLEGPAGPYNQWAGGIGDFNAASAMNSTTADNGLLIVDSDLFGADANYDAAWIENSWVQTSSPINCAATENVKIAFQTRYRCWDNGASDDSEKCLVEVSRDGINWPDVNTISESEGVVDYGDGVLIPSRWEVFPGYETGSQTDNPSFVDFDISSAAGLQEEVWIRFRWKGTWGYSWEIDDIIVSELPENDLKIESYVSTTDFLNTGNYELGAIPVDYLSSYQTAAVDVRNAGLLDQSGVQLSLTLDDILISNSSPTTLDYGETITLQAPYSLQEASSIGFHEIGFSVTSDGPDAYPEDNFTSRSIEITEHQMGRDNGQMTAPFPEDATDDFIALNPFLFGEDVTIYGIDVALVEGSESEAEIVAHLFDPADPNFLSEQYGGLVTSTDVKSLSVDMMNTGSELEVNWYTLTFDNPLTVPSGTSIAAAIESYGGMGVQIWEAQYTYNSTSFTYGPFGSGSAYGWYYTNEVPMIRLNLDPEATNTNNTGCTSQDACNYDPNAEEDDGSCIYENCGCMDETACNYDAGAEFDDGSCCVCIESGITMDLDGLDYLIGTWQLSPAEGAFSIGPEPLSGEWFSSVENGLEATQYDDSWSFYPSGEFVYSNSGSTVVPWLNYTEQVVTFEPAFFEVFDNGPFFGGSTFSISGMLSNELGLVCGWFGAMDSGPEYEVLTITETSLTVVGQQSTQDCNVGDGFWTLTFEKVEDTALCSQGCFDEMACNYDPDVIVIDNETCVYPGCDDPSALNYDAESGCPADCIYLTYDCASIGDAAWVDEDMGLFPEWQEAMHGVAWEGEWVFNVPATIIESVSGVSYGIDHVDWVEVSGLPSWAAADYSLSDLDASSQYCIAASGIPTTPGMHEVTASGEVFISIFGQPFSIGIQSYSAWLDVLENPNPIPGCTYANAVNFVVYATADDASCLFAGCTDESAGNYSPLATIDDGSCGEPCSPGGDSSCATDVNYDGAVNVSDLLLLLSEFGANCE